MRFGFSLNAFKRFELEESIQGLAEIGYPGVELLLDTPHLDPGRVSTAELGKIANRLADAGITVCNCNAFMLSAIERSPASHRTNYGRETANFHHPSFVEHEAADRHARIDHTKACLQVAAELGAPHISIPPGGPVPTDMDEEVAMDHFVSALRDVASTAADVNVDVLVEPEPDLLIERSDELLAVLERIDSPRVGCNFDAGHFYCVGEDPVELVETLAPYTPHYHLEDIPADRRHVHTQLGEGSMDIVGFLEAVEATRFDEFVTVELYPYQEAPFEAAENAMTFLRERGWA